MGVGAGLYIYDDVVKRFTFAISSPDEFLYKRSPQKLVFTARHNARIASAVLAMAIPSVRLSVCLSVCLSHAGIVSKRRHVARWSLHYQIAKNVSSFVETKTRTHQEMR